MEGEEQVKVFRDFNLVEKIPQKDTGRNERKKARDEAERDCYS